MNTVILIGRLGDNMKVYEKNGKTFGRIRLAVDRFKISQDKKEKLDPIWVTCFIHGPKCQKLVPYLTKGRKISILGTLNSDKNGQISVMVNRIEFLSNKQEQTIETQIPPEITEDEPF